jgi:hypothetical protein
MKNIKKYNFHVPLPEDLYQKLREEALRSNQPATELARYAINYWLEVRKKQAIHEAIANYAAEYGGTDIDLDKELEFATIEHLLAEGKG